MPGPLYFDGGRLPASYANFYISNAAVLDVAATYQRRADQIHAVGPTTLFFLEWCLVLLPILFHGLIGMVIVLRGKRNVWNYPYSGNIRYTLQRVTGVVANGRTPLAHCLHTAIYQPREQAAA